MDTVQKTPSIGFKSRLGAIGIGILFMVVALVVQEIIESVLSIYFLFTVGAHSLSKTLLDFESGNIVLYSVFIGLAAGFCQEFSKFVAVDTRKLSLTIFVGLGFSFVDIAVLMAGNIQEFASLTGFAVLLIFFNTVESLVFHPSTSLILKWGHIKSRKVISLAYSVLVHAAIDGGLVYTDLLILSNPHLYRGLSLEYWGIVFALTIITALIAFILTRGLEEIQVKEGPVVY